MNGDEMATNEYHFMTRWRVQGDIHTVADILNDPLGLMRWWPSVYLDVRIIEPGDAHGVGRVVEVYTKGWLPYTLRWRFRVTDVPYPHGFTLEAQGDFVGRGIWTLAQDGAWVDVTYDWQIVATKPLLRRLSFLFKPLFAANHRWAMARGEESLRLELARRQAATPEERALIPAPPPPTATPRVPVLAAVGAGIAVAGVVGYRVVQAQTTRRRPTPR
jgi:hypothetical protein